MVGAERAEERGDRKPTHSNPSGRRGGRSGPWWLRWKRRCVCACAGVSAALPRTCLLSTQWLKPPRHLSCTDAFAWLFVPAAHPQFNVVFFFFAPCIRVFATSAAILIGTLQRDVLFYFYDIVRWKVVHNPNFWYIAWTKHPKEVQVKWFPLRMFLKRLPTFFVSGLWALH